MNGEQKPNATTLNSSRVICVYTFPDNLVIHFD